MPRRARIALSWALRWLRSPAVALSVSGPSYCQAAINEPSLLRMIPFPITAAEFNRSENPRLRERYCLSASMDQVLKNGPDLAS